MSSKDTLSYRLCVRLDIFHVDYQNDIRSSENIIKTLDYLKIGEEQKYFDNRLTKWLIKRADIKMLEWSLKHNWLNDCKITYANSEDNEAVVRKYYREFKIMNPIMSVRTLLDKYSCKDNITCFIQINNQI